MDDYVATLLDNTREAALEADDIAAQLSLPEVAADSRYYLYLSKKAARIAPYAQAHNSLRQAVDALEANRKEQAAATGEMLALYREEERELTRKLEEATADAAALAHYMQNGGNAPCVLTVRQESGSSFAAEVLRLYARYLDLVGVGYDLAEDKTGGTLRVQTGGLGRLRHEAGLHKRSDGASCTVTVMPLPPEGKVEISPEEIRVDIFCSTGKGGQNVNKVETAVRITHLPTGTVVTCQDERSQLMNKRRALATLAQRLQTEQDRRQAADYVRTRDDQIRDRSNPVRRYDLQRNLLRDTRTDCTVPLREALRGKIDPLVRAMALHSR